MGLRSTIKNKEKKNLRSRKKAPSEKNMQAKKAKLNPIGVLNSARESYSSDETDVLDNKKKVILKKVQHSPKEKEKPSAVIMRKTLMINKLETYASLHERDEFNEGTNRPCRHRSNESSETNKFQNIELVENKVKREDLVIRIKNSTEVHNNKVKIGEQSNKLKSVKSKTKMDLMNRIITEKCSELKISTENFESEDDSISSDDDTRQNEDSPRICYYKLLELLNLLEAKEHPNTQQKNANLCRRYMNPSCQYNTRFSSNVFVVTAIKQSLFARKWNNVTRLLMLLIQQFDSRYSVYIRTVMQMIKLLNPLIQNSTLQSDIDTIAKSALKSRGRDVNNLPNIV